MISSEKKEEKRYVTDVKLTEGKAPKDTFKVQFYWHIYTENIRAGKVYIVLEDNEVLGRHSAINIFLNKKSQGKGIGRLAYKKACEESGLPIIYAHMRKSNIASKKAALAAGFQEIDNDKFKQLVLVWKQH